MRVVIDATPLLVQSAGVKNYLYYWIQHLRQLAGPERIRTIPALDPLPPLTHEQSIAGFWRTHIALGVLALANHTPLPVSTWATRHAGLFHTTHLLRNPPRRGLLTTTLHDLTTSLMPELHTPANVLSDRTFAATLKRADGVIAVSQNTKDDAVRLLGLPPQKIAVIHSGISRDFFKVPTAAIDSVRERYRLRRPFVLFAGTIEPRKNIDLLLDAYAQLAPSLREEFELVLVGPIGWAQQQTIARVLQLRYLGY